MVTPQPGDSGAPISRTTAWHVGVDVAKRQDYTAICVARVVQCLSPLDGQRETAYVVRTLEQIALGTDYMDQAQALCAILAGVSAQALDDFARRPPLPRRPGALGDYLAARGLSLPDTESALPAVRLYADETGVGDSFCDAVARLLSLDSTTRDVEMLPVHFVAGERCRRHRERGRMRVMVGKELFARRLTTMVFSRRVTLPVALTQRADVEHEFRTYEARMREEDGHTTYGAHAPGAHDDLLTAIALAILEDPHARTAPTEYGPKLWWGPR